MDSTTLDFTQLDTLRTHHPAWRLLRSDHAALVASFLHRVFVIPNVRVMAAADLAEALEDELYALRPQLGEKGATAFPKPALEYLNDWAAPDKGWLRKFYKTGTDEAQFDPTPATEKAIAWLLALSARQFVGTESRLLTLFDLLKQMSEGSQADPAKRLAELHKKRAEIDAEIARVSAGDVPLMDDTALKDRFQQFMQGARELLTDFREWSTTSASSTAASASASRCGKAARARCWKTSWASAMQLPTLTKAKAFARSGIFYCPAEGRTS